MTSALTRDIELGTKKDRRDKAGCAKQTGRIELVLPTAWRGPGPANGPGNGACVLIWNLGLVASQSAVCVGVKGKPVGRESHTYIHTHGTHIYIYIYIYICVSVCLEKKKDI